MGRRLATGETGAAGAAVCVLLAMAMSVAACGPTGPPPPTPIERLGKRLFFDARLSVRGNQSCATCHAPQAGWTGDRSDVNAGPVVYEASIAGSFGNRKPPSIAYAMAPTFHTEVAGGQLRFVGGAFWDGRATGERLGDPLADQAQGPFVNPVEQALPDPACLVRLACRADYRTDFDRLFPGGCGIVWPDDTESVCTTQGAPGGLRLKRQDRAIVTRTYDFIGRALAAYERSREVNPFSSAYDRHLAGEEALTAEAKLGLAIFEGKGKCGTCHSTTKGEKGEPPLLTNFGFANIGVPRNTLNPFYRNTQYNPNGEAWTDAGLGAFVYGRADYRAYGPTSMGRHKVPTLRNVAKRPSESFVKAYTHNGYFKTLEGVVHFHNTRDTLPRCAGPIAEREALAQGCWPAPEVEANVTTTDVGRLGLTPQDEAALVAFLTALSDENPAP